MDTPGIRIFLMRSFAAAWSETTSKGIDETLQAIYGSRTADFVAMQLEYPMQRVLQ